MKWFPKHKGITMGVVVGGFGGGAFVFNTIQTAILNPDNVNPATFGPDEGYFTDADLLGRVPGLLLILGGIYLILGMIACLLITQPPEDWLDKNVCDEKESLEYVTPLEAFKRKELYLLWVTRLSVVLISNFVSGFYKAFGQTFIFDDQFLGIIGAATSFFNCTGRLFYGMIMDKFSYKVSMSMEACLLLILVSTFYLTSIIGVDDTARIPQDISNLSVIVANATLGVATEAVPSTSLTTKIVYSLWIFAIYFTFPGTFSTQPAVTTQTFGHKYGGFIYAFLFSSDIVNNLIVALASKPIKESLGWLGLFLIVSAWGGVALIATLLYPLHPRPGVRPSKIGCQNHWLAKIGLTEELEKHNKSELEKYNKSEEDGQVGGRRMSVKNS